MIDKISPAFAAPRTPDDPTRVRDAAQQFEALLLAQIVKTMREGGSGGWLGTGSDESGLAAMELAEEHFAQALSQNGGLGLVDVIVSGLSR